MSETIRLLNDRQVKGLNRIGDAFIPGDGELPKFSVIGCTDHADRILAFISDRDRNDLKTALTVFSYLPGFVLEIIWKFMEWGQNLPGGPGALIRMGRIGLKGLVVSLYYSGGTAWWYTGPTPLDILGYDVSVYTEDLEDSGA